MVYSRYFLSLLLLGMVGSSIFGQSMFSKEIFSFMEKQFLAFRDEQDPELIKKSNKWVQELRECQEHKQLKMVLKKNESDEDGERDRILAQNGVGLLRNLFGKCGVCLNDKNNSVKYCTVVLVVTFAGLIKEDEDIKIFCQDIIEQYFMGTKEEDSEQDDPADDWM